MTEETFVPAVGRNVVYCYARDLNDYTTKLHAYMETEHEQSGVFEYDGPVEFRPAQIVRVWSDMSGAACNLVVFVDGPDDQMLEVGATRDRLAFWKAAVLIADDFSKPQVGRFFPRIPQGG